MKNLTPEGLIYKDDELTLHNYKEPLTEVEDGFGYYGTVTATKDGKYIQCHICGSLEENMGNHLRYKHGTNGREYKERYGLAYQTALVSENYRIKQKMHQLEIYKSLTDEEKEERKKILRKAYEAKSRSRKLRPQPEIQLETKNKRGTCPDQLLQRIRDVAEDLGHTPSKSEFIGETGTQRFVHLIYKTFGSWTAAVDLAGLRPKERDRSFKRNTEYTDDELLAYLENFAREHKKEPSTSDFHRKLLPPIRHYHEHFGGIQNARELAGVYTILESIR